PHVTERPWSSAVSAMREFTTAEVPHGGTHEKEKTLESRMRLTSHVRCGGGPSAKGLVTGTSLAAYPTASPVREDAIGKGPEPRAPRRRPTSLGERPGETGWW